MATRDLPSGLTRRRGGAAIDNYLETVPPDDVKFMLSKVASGLESQELGRAPRYLALRSNRDGGHCACPGCRSLSSAHHRIQA